MNVTDTMVSGVSTQSIVDVLIAMSRPRLAWLAVPENDAWAAELRNRFFELDRWLRVHEEAWPQERAFVVELVGDTRTCSPNTRIAVFVGKPFHVRNHVPGPWSETFEREFYWDSGVLYAAKFATFDRSFPRLAVTGADPCTVVRRIYGGFVCASGRMESSNVVITRLTRVVPPRLLQSFKTIWAYMLASIAAHMKRVLRDEGQHRLVCFEESLDHPRELFDALRGRRSLAGLVMQQEVETAERLLSAREALQTLLVANRVRCSPGVPITFGRDDPSRTVVACVARLLTNDGRL